MGGAPPNTLVGKVKIGNTDDWADARTGQTATSPEQEIVCCSAVGAWMLGRQHETTMIPEGIFPKTKWKIRVPRETLAASHVWRSDEANPTRTF